MLTIRTMCAEPLYDGKEWKEKFVMVYPYYGEKRYINEKRLLKNSHEKRFFDEIRKSSFLFYTSVLLQQRKFFKTNFPVTSVIGIWFLTRWYIVYLLEVLKVIANRKQKYYGIIVAYFIIREVRIILFSL